MTEYLSGAVAACLIIGSTMLAVLLVSGCLVPGAWQEQHLAQIATSAPSQILAEDRQAR